MFDESRYGASAGGGAHQHGRAAAKPARVPQVFVVGANASTLGIVTSLKDERVAAQLIPLAITPRGVAAGLTRQAVNIPLAELFDWVDRTFPPDDERAFVASMRDVELLARIGWNAPFPEPLDDRAILNVEDVPDEIADALARPAATLLQCAACRRLCVRDDFVWKEKQLCAWDYHAQVFGRRGPWRDGTYEERHFDTLPSCAYVAPELLTELGVEVLLTTGRLPATAAAAVVNTLLANDPGRPHMAIHSKDGIVILSEGTLPSVSS